MLSQPHRRLAALIAVVAIAAAAVVAFVSWRVLRVLRMPAPRPRVVQVVVSSPGSAMELETSLTTPLEAQLASVPGLRSMTSWSSEGVVVVSCVFDPFADPLTAATDVRAHVRPDRLPADASVAVAQASPSQHEVFRYEVTHDQLALVEIRRLHDQQVRSLVERAPGVTRIDECGVGEPEIRVGLDPLRLQGYGLRPDQVRRELDRLFLSPSSGDDGQSGMRNLVIGSAQGAPIRLSDVATFRISTSPHPCSCLVKGKPALCVSVSGGEAGDPQQGIATALRAQLRQWAEGSTAGLQLHVPDERDADTSFRVGLWPMGELGEEGEVRAAQAAARALESIAAGAKSRIRVGEADGARRLSSAAGEVEVRDLDAATRKALEAKLSAAIEREAPWLRASPDDRKAAGREVVVQGPDLVQLARLSRDVRDKVAAVDGVRQAIVTGVGQRAALEIHLDRERAALLGVPTPEALGLLVLATQGQLLRAGLALDSPAVRLELAGVGRDPAEVGSLRLPSRNAGSVSLRDIAEIRMGAQPDPILHEDRQRAVIVRVWGPDDPPGDWQDRLVQAVSGISMPPGASLRFRDTRAAP